MYENDDVIAAHGKNGIVKLPLDVNPHHHHHHDRANDDESECYLTTRRTSGTEHPLVTHPFVFIHTDSTLNTARISEGRETSSVGARRVSGV